MSSDMNVLDQLGARAVTRGRSRPTHASPSERNKSCVSRSPIFDGVSISKPSDDRCQKTTLPANSICSHNLSCISPSSCTPKPCGARASRHQSSLHTGVASPFMAAVVRSNTDGSERQQSQYTSSACVFPGVACTDARDASLSSTRDREASRAH